LHDFNFCGAAIRQQKFTGRPGNSAQVSCLAERQANSSIWVPLWRDLTKLDVTKLHGEHLVDSQPKMKSNLARDVKNHPLQHSICVWTCIEEQNVSQLGFQRKTAAELGSPKEPLAR
jgi:hypothetical protein